MKRYLIVMLILTFVMTPLIASFTVSAEGTAKKPSVYLNFEENFKDATGNSHDGTKSGKVAFSEGVIGKGAEFSGGNLVLANTSNLDFSKGITLSVWLKLNPDENKISWPILYKEGTEPGWPIMLYHIGYGGTVIQADLGFGKDYWNTTFGFMSNSRVESAQIIEKWAHIAAVYNGQDQKVYVDGELFDSQNVPEDFAKIVNQLAKSSRDLVIGKSAESDFKGYMDELKIYNEALSEDDIVALYKEVAGAYNGEIELKIDDPTIYVNGVATPVDPNNDSITPVVIDDRTLVPIRPIIVAIGGQIGWDGKERRVDLTYKSNKLQLWLDNKNAKVNGKDMKQDVPPMSIDGLTFLPLRFVSENLGMKVEWNQSNQSIILRYVKD